tara:strand:+ start:669 stop:2498 length:1830 start_codon:yes stop_codon:yes gene_type:complete
MAQQLSLFQNPQVKNLIIFLIVSAFAIQALLLIINYGNDIPLADDDQIFLGYRIADDLEVTPKDFYDPHFSHVPLFIRLVTVPLLLTFSFTAMPIFYLNWVFVCIAIIFIYYLLKQTNEKSTWLLIPISMLVFSPLQESTFTFSQVGLQQTLPFLSFILIIFLLNTKKLNFFRISLALFFVGIVMFSAQAFVAFIIGPIMLLSLIKQDKNRNKWLAIWIFGNLCLSILLITVMMEDGCITGHTEDLVCVPNIVEGNFSELFSSEKIYAFFFSLGSSVFRVKFNEAYIIIGAVIVISFLVSLLYTLYNKKKLSSLIPWCQYGLIGLIFISLVTIGRFHLWGGESIHIELHYLRLESFLHIGLLILTNEIFTYWKNKISKNKKKLLNIILIIFITSIILMLIPSYTIGWKNAEASSDWKNDVLSGCLLLPAKTTHFDSFEYCSKSFIPKGIVTYSDRQDYAPEIWNFFLKNNYNVFSNEKFNEGNSKDLIKFTKKWNSSKNTFAFNGTIEKINSENIIEDKIFQLDNFQVAIQGSIKNVDFDQIDYFYLFLNDQPFAKIVDIKNSQNNLILWHIVFLSGYIPDGCHEFSLGFIEGNSKFISLDQIKFCKIK